MTDAAATAVFGITDLSPSTLSFSALRRRLATYAKPDAWRATAQLANTALPFLASMAALVFGLAYGYWLAGLFALPAALLVVRLFVIQHDCGHGSFFVSRHANEIVGRLLSALTLMPYTFWRRDHAVHHATAGNLDRRGTGDITTLTVAEYQSRPVWQRFLYRMYRHPLVLFGIGPAFILLIHYRLPTRAPHRDWQGWVSILGTDAAAAVIAAGASLIVAPGVFLIAWVVVLYLAASIGMWLFSIQHQFEDTYWERSARWDFGAAAIEGSSFYDLPRVLHWFTASIGLHHIHHLASKIPNYRLRACLEQNQELQRAKRLTLWKSIKSARLALWDENRRELVSFRDAAAMAT
jgi:acyl-lipid omega-6 desaturase (Delta-12 desaturase)